MSRSPLRRLASPALLLLLVLCPPTGEARAAGHDAGAAGAADKLPGYLGRTEIDTNVPGHSGEQYWSDTDGVDPEVAGCHFPFAAKEASGKCAEPLGPAGVFGEFCNPASGDPMHQSGFPVGSLIESNPDAGICHPHHGAKGHPDVFDCDAYCKGTKSAKSAGKCVADVCDVDAGVPSARCECTEPK